MNLPGASAAPLRQSRRAGQFNGRWKVKYASSGTCCETFVVTVPGKRRRVFRHEDAAARYAEREFLELGCACGKDVTIDWRQLKTEGYKPFARLGIWGWTERLKHRNGA